jgi:predicted RNase H-like nuclease (RuvC/YqgF family)
MFLQQEILKQIQNLQQQYKNPSGMIDDITELANHRSDIIHMFQYHPARTVVLISNFGMEMLKRFKM